MPARSPAEPPFRRHLEADGQEALREGLGHVHEPIRVHQRAPSAQGAAELEVHLVLDEHQVAGIQARVDPARGVGHDQHPRAERVHDAQREGHLGRRIPFVQVEAPLLGDDGDAAGLPDDEPARVPLHRGHREAGQIVVVHRDRRGQGVGEPAEAGAQDERDARHGRGAASNHLHAPGDVVRREVDAIRLAEPAAHRASCSMLRTLVTRRSMATRFLPSLGNDDVGVALGRLDELEVHRAHALLRTA